MFDNITYSNTCCIKKKNIPFRWFWIVYHIRGVGTCLKVIDCKTRKEGIFLFVQLLPNERSTCEKVVLSIELFSYTVQINQMVHCFHWSITKVQKMKLLSLISRNGALLYQNVCCNCFYKLIHRYSYSKSKSKKKKNKKQNRFCCILRYRVLFIVYSV